ncbi:unnamed protein product [Rotaria sordida]|uniref:Uncharacterized protein n=1 Tax=Rotaria sordida TaxID=392033 RepID=A0A815E796_9BILA|nr:unnamed protein product [Rotaria sordida]CAF1603909.1 unnamed protein product [Rotaria sordida]
MFCVPPYGFIWLIGVHYAGISFHHVNTRFKLNTFILCCRAYELENQTSPNIRRFVNSILDEFGLSFDTSSSYVVSHNENKTRCAFADLKMLIEKLSDEQSPTIHLVVPLRQYLINCCVVRDDDEGGLISIKIFIGSYPH